MFRELGPPGIHHNQFGPVNCCRPFHFITDDGMSFGGVRTDNEKDLVEFNFTDRVGHRPATKRSGQTGHGGSVSGAGAVINVVGANHRAHKFLHQKVLFISAAGGAQGRNGIAAVSSRDSFES